MRLSSWLHRPLIQQTGLFLLAFVVLYLTRLPTLYTFDSAEFATAAWTLGLPHAPGYPLYIVLAHLFTKLPLGLDVAGKVNLYSGLCLALATPAVYGFILRLFKSRWLACGTTLVWVWSYHVWSAGIVAEVYAAQAATLAWTGWALATLPGSGRRGALLGGVAYGVALGIHPGSVLFAPGVAAAYLVASVPPRHILLAAMVCAAVFGLAVLYLPLRYTAGATYTLLGRYDSMGQFVPVDLTTPGGLFWVLRGAQFNDLFFNPGGQTILSRVLQFGGWLWANFLGLGALVGLVGILALRRRPHLLLVWALSVLPFALFYLTYGAPDVETMLVPLYLLWMVVFAAGWQWFAAAAGNRAIAVIFVYAAILLLLNYPLLDSSRNDNARRRAELMLASLPERGIALGGWFDIVPLQYLQLVEGARPNVRLYNLFLYDEPALREWLAHLVIEGETVVILGQSEDIFRLPLPAAQLEPVIFDASPSEIDTLRLEAYTVSSTP